MVMENISQWLPSSTDLNLHTETPLFWQQCHRRYRFQPIYRVTGRLLAIELLTAVYHPMAPERNLSPEAWFAGLDIAQRLNVVYEQLELLAEWTAFFEHNDVVASVNIDGPSLLAIQHRPAIRRLIASLPWIRFELTEHQALPQEEKVAKIPELGPLWLDDFGSGMANFSALTELKYDYIKLSRDLFTMLGTTNEGRSLFSMLLALINRYCNGVIVEGVETEAQWQQVKASPAIAAQGYYFSRPVPFSELNHLTIQLP
ncbi:cyclic-guanylate-specific phosphodiesterase [Pantoea sp. B550]|uniref:cyclic-guanylate-specific phosphodiesterase n=1 Tax=Pantoea TaxID=53335 RepID=UPI0013779818|nr:MULTISPECIES: cyclic-guanylate-specific phosphodiesterase [Pantoea]MCP1206416.1 cyclic-guanylate-specific phosphodiesterase [Pantoea sp. B550]MCT2420350.1 cyclic-guanylate-specific phosphodiesterase [Pantoea sp. XY16]NBB55075.1 cyclic-guanylate-specific phosphodiesterase [Pantoea vagans]QZX95600.1 cyclic-guanylate-specific phosphodiesterase [Pantoea alfalfae]WIL41930.1 cyclic-guanylate-specific phosphodiesterase [Pantoea agglomerans]